MKNEKITLWQRRIADKKSSGLKLEEWCAKRIPVWYYADTVERIIYSCY